MSVVSIDVVKDWLGITKPDTDTLVQDTVDAAEAYLARRIGAGSILGVETITQRATGYRNALTLTTFPVVSVTSVTGSDGALVPLSTLDVDLSAGILRTSSTLYATTTGYPFILPWYSVVYQAGFTTLDFDYTHAVKEASRWLWGAQRGPKTGGQPEAAKANLDAIIASLPRYGAA